MKNLTWEEKIEINLEGLVKSCKAMLERIEKMENNEHSEQKQLDIVPAGSAVDNTLESLLVPESVPLRLDICSELITRMPCESALPDLKSHSAPYWMSPAWGRLPFVIEAALLKGIAWTSISEAIKTLISERETTA
jgi:hypothetical protein